MLVENYSLWDRFFSVLVGAWVGPKNHRETTRDWTGVCEQGSNYNSWNSNDVVSCVLEFLRGGLLLLGFFGSFFRTLSLCRFVLDLMGNFYCLVRGLLLGAGILDTVFSNFWRFVATPRLIGLLKRKAKLFTDRFEICTTHFDKTSPVIKFSAHFMKYQQ